MNEIGHVHSQTVKIPVCARLEDFGVSRSICLRLRLKTISPYHVAETEEILAGISLEGASAEREIGTYNLNQLELQFLRVELVDLLLGVRLAGGKGRHIAARVPKYLTRRECEEKEEKPPRRLDSEK